MITLPTPGPKYDANNESEMRNVLSRVMAKVFRTDTAPDLLALEALTGTGIAARTADDTWALLGYADSTWTPTLSFATPGNLSVGYLNRLGYYLKFGRLVVLFCDITTNSFTHTTASGNLIITGAPLALSMASGAAIPIGSLIFNGITKATHTQFAPYMQHGSTTILVATCGSGVSATTITAAEVPSGGTVILQFAALYLAAS